MFIVRAMSGRRVVRRHIRRVMSTPPRRTDGWMSWFGHFTHKIDAPSVLLVGNFDVHVPDEDINVVSEATAALVCQLLTNSAAVSQPLAVGAVGTLKKKITV